MDTQRLEEMHREIESIKRAVVRLRELSGGIQAVDRNVHRILASTKMLEINVSDLLQILSK